MILSQAFNLIMCAKNYFQVNEHSLVRKWLFPFGIPCQPTMTCYLTALLQNFPQYWITTPILIKMETSIFQNLPFLFFFRTYCHQSYNTLKMHILGI